MKELLPLLPHPSHYAGIEEGAVYKNSCELRCALAFPDLYEVGMSYLGQKILYDILNQQPEIAAERVFAPSLEAGEILRQHGVPLATLESDTPLAQTALLGFAVTHELCYTNILYMLDLAGIPFHPADRGESLQQWPLIVAGGGCTIAAEPLAPFMDIMLLGDGEELLLEFCRLLIKARSEGWSRSEFIRKSVAISGVYAPSLYTHDDKGILTPVYADLPKPARRIVADLDKVPYPEHQVVPFGAVHNRLSLEIARGCTRSCRFCQAGVLYRPARERTLPVLETLLDRCLRETGFDDVSFLSLSTGDFSALKTFFLHTADRCASEQIAVSLPSLRVGSLDGEIMAKMAGIRRTGATLAPEAGSQRLRDRINKGITEEELLNHVRALAGYGWQQVKLYFMIGLPGEEEEDLAAIHDLCCKARDAAGRPRLQVTAAISPFVPKPFTPFQWEPQISLEEIQKRIQLLRSLFFGEKSLKLHWHEPKTSSLEGLLSRGDRRLAAVVESAYRKNALFCSWMDYFRLEPWLEALEEQGLHFEEFTGSRQITQDDGTPAPLPWDHLESGVSREYLLRELKRSESGQLTRDCRYAPCNQCGACDTAKPSLLPSPSGERHCNRLNLPQRDQTPSAPPQRPVPQQQNKKRCPPSLDPALIARAVRYRIWHNKEGAAAFLSQLELQTLLERSMRRAGLPLSFSQGFHPMPLISFGRALPVGVESQAEWFSVTLRAFLSADEVMQKLNPRMLRGMPIVKVEQIPLYEKSVGGSEEIFLAQCLNPDHTTQFASAFANFAAQEHFPLTKETKKGSVVLDIRTFVSHLHVETPNNSESLGQITFIADWSQDYLSPLTLVRGIVPWIGLNELKLVKIRQSWQKK